MAKFNCAALLRKRQFQRVTGVEPSLFLEMVEKVRARWQQRVVDPKDRSGRPWGIGGLEDHLLVLLILYRCAITQDFLGLLYGVDKAAISRALHRIEPIVAQVLGVKRTIRVTREEAEALIVDATEQPIQRPSRKQRCWYSGKKKRHTIKTEAIITEQGKIVSVSKPVPGRVHDLEIRRRGPPVPKGARLYPHAKCQELVGRITTPSQMIAAEKGIFTFSAGIKPEDFVGKFGGPFELQKIVGANHTFSLEGNREALFAKTLSWFKKHSLG